MIANNGAGGKQAGVQVQSGTGVEILSNSIHDNTNGGIFLSPQANSGQPAPVLTLAQSAAGQTEIAGTLTVSPATGANDNFTIQFFSNNAADGAGHYEGQTLIGHTVVTTDANRDASFDVRLPVGTTVGANITATATQQGVQNTSVFSAPLPVTAAPTTDLRVTVAPNPSPDLFGTNETYVVTIQNTGANDDTNVVYTGTIDTNSAFVSAVSSQGTAPTFANNIITADLGTIAAGQSATVTIVVTPIAVGTISLTSTANGDIIDTSPSNNTGIVTTVTVNPSADVDILSVSGTPAGRRGRAGPLVRRHGHQQRPERRERRDPHRYDPRRPLRHQRRRLVRARSSASRATSTPSTSATSRSTARTRSRSTPAPPRRPGLIVNQVSAQSSSVADPNPLNNAGSASVTVENAVNLGLAVVAAPNPATAGQPLTYTINVGNATDPITGLVPSPATAVVLTDQLPAGIDPNSVVVTTTQGTFTITSGLVTVNLGTINPDQAPPIVTISVVPLTSGTYVNTATVTDSAEINVNTTTSQVITTVLASPSDLSVAVVPSPNPGVLGAPLTYFVTVTNNSNFDAPGTVAVDQLAASAAFKGTSLAPGTFTIANQRVTANLGLIPSGKTVTFAIVVVPTLSGPIGDIAGVASTNFDPNTANNLTAITTLVSPADLIVGGVSSTKVPTVGDPFVYAFTVFNAGPAPAVNAGLNITIPANAVYAGSQTSQGFTGLGNGVLSAALGTLAPNSFATVFVTLIPTAIGVEKATATAFSSNFDPNAANNVASVTTTSNNFPGTFQLASANYAGGENAGTIPVTINRLDGTLGAITVNYTTVAGTAKAGVNYTTTAGTVVFANGQTSATINVPVTDDGVITGNLNFFFAITGADNGGTLGSPAAATVTVINTDRDLVPPEVEAVVPLDTGPGLVGYVVDFSKPVNPATAANPANYTLFASGRDAGTANAFIPVSATYDAAHNAVILVTARPLALNAFYGLMINGSAGGITDLSGNVLDGDGDGVAGGYYAAYVGMGNSLTYLDSANNAVNLASANATMLMLRNFSGDPYEVEMLGASGRAAIAGSVHRFGSSSGVTAIGEISGLGPFGSVNTNALTSPPFYVGSSNFTPSLPIPQSITAAEVVGQSIPNGPRYVLARLTAKASSVGRQARLIPVAARTRPHSGSRAARSGSTNLPSTRIGTPSKAIVPPPYSGRWICTRSQWTFDRLPLSASS